MSFKQNNVEVITDFSVLVYNSVSSVDRDLIGYVTANANGSAPAVQVGTYSFLSVANNDSSAGAVALGVSVAGSTLYPGGLAGDTSTDNYLILSNLGTVRTGTWRCCGYSNNSAGGGGNQSSITLYLRIA